VSLAAGEPTQAARQAGRLLLDLIMDGLRYRSTLPRSAD